MFASKQEHARYWDRQAQTARNRASAAEGEAATHEAKGRVAWARSLRLEASRARMHANIASLNAQSWRMTVDAPGIVVVSSGVAA